MIDEDTVIDLIIRMISENHITLNKLTYDKESMRFLFKNHMLWNNEIQSLKQGKPVFINPSLIDDLYRHILFNTLMNSIKETDSIRVEKDGELILVIDNETDLTKILTKICLK